MNNLIIKSPMKISERYFLDSRKERNRLNSKFDYQMTLNQVINLGFKKGMSFLDVGCAAGSMLRMISNYDRKNSNFFGLDVNKDFIAYAKKRAALMKNKQTHFITGNAYNMPFKDNTFDFVWSRFLLEHLIDPIAALKEMHRVTKKNGIIVVGDLDGNCVFHYPINIHLERRILKAMNALKPFGFDPFIGRKLFSFMKMTGSRGISVLMYPYHNIYGNPKAHEWNNWTVKIRSTVDFLFRSKILNRDSAQKLGKDFLALIKSPNVFSYSTLIFVKGIK